MKREPKGRLCYDESRGRSPPAKDPESICIPENVYGHRKRLEWIVAQLRQNDVIVELGCGTGYMICRPLCRLGYDAYGVDLDRRSIEYGRQLVEKEGQSPNRLQAIDLCEFDAKVDVVIASEVLEHIPTPDLPATFDAIKSVLKPGGQLLVTVPNGHGWFEYESYLYFKAGVGRIFEWCRVPGAIKFIKQLLRAKPDVAEPSTLADSPHVQWFTLREAIELLESQGFDVVECRGSVLVAGPFSNMFFTGIGWAMRLNRRLGDAFPRFASGFYLRTVQRR